MLRRDRGSTQADGLLWLLRHITGIATTRLDSKRMFGPRDYLRRRVVAPDITFVLLLLPSLASSSFVGQTFAGPALRGNRSAQSSSLQKSAGCTIATTASRDHFRFQIPRIIRMSVTAPKRRLTAKRIVLNFQPKLSCQPALCSQQFSEPQNGRLRGFQYAQWASARPLEHEERPTTQGLDTGAFIGREIEQLVTPSDIEALSDLASRVRAR